MRARDFGSPGDARKPIRSILRAWDKRRVRSPSL
jgi:hypothetical protein